MHIKRLDANVTSRNGLVEAHFLPTISCSKASFLDRFLASKVKVLALLAMRLRALEVKTVDDGFLESFGYRIIRADDIDHDDFVLTFLEPATRHIKCLLRANLPETSHRMTIHVKLALAPGLQIDECITYLRELEGSTVGSSRIRIRLNQRLPVHGLHGLVVIADVEDGPEFWLNGDGSRLFGTNLIDELHLFGDTLEVLDGAAEVDATHGFHQNVELVALLDGRHLHLGLVLSTIEGTNLHTVHEDLGIVMRLGHTEHAGRDILVEGVAIDDTAPTLIELFHGLDTCRYLARRKVVEDGSHLGELNLGDGDGRNGGRHLALLLSVHILGHHLTQFVVLGRSLTCLVDGSIVIIAGHIGCKARAVSASPVSPVCATVSHIEREGDALREHFVETFDHILGSTGLMLAAPLVEPSAPKLRAHFGSIGTQFAETTELVIDVGSRAEVHGPDEIVETIVGEIARPVALEQLHFVEAYFAQRIANSADIRLIDTVGTIFILDLHHDDGTSLVDGEVSHLFGHLRLEDLQTLHKIGIEFAQTNVFLFEQPPWQTTHLPFGTNIRTGTKDDIHAVLLSQLDESAEVVVLGEVEHSFLLLMDVPEHVETQRIHAECLTHLDAMFPIGTRDAWIMHLGSFNYKGLTVEQESTLASLESAGDLRCRLWGRSCCCLCGTRKTQ